MDMAEKSIVENDNYNNRSIVNSVYGWLFRFYVIYAKCNVWCEI